MSISAELFYRAQQHIPGGVNSPVRAFKNVGGTPVFLKRAKGAYIIDVDDKHYIDYVGSWGPMILGHAHERIQNAVLEAVENSLSFGAPTANEIELADKISELVPSMEMVRMVNSGTEATMSAIRLARGFTGRNKILKFAGCYHGHSDSLLVEAGSGGLTFGVPNSPGVPECFAQQTLVADFNDLNSVQQLVENYHDDLAAIIVEPVAGNMNCIPPEPGFLEGLRELCDHYRCLLIFDEVITGFRVALGGAQQRYGVTPDLTTLGKIIGGGMPVGAFGGSKAIMEHLAPQGPVYQAGTLSGNPIAMAAGLAGLEELSAIDPYTQLEETAYSIANQITQIALAANVPMSANVVGGLFGLFFTTDEKVTCFEQVARCDQERFKQFFHRMLKQGIYFAPSPFESSFVSTAHHAEEVHLTLAAAEEVFSVF